MTRRDYIAFATAFRNSFDELAAQTESSPATTWNSALEHVIRVLETDNPRFDREHFLAVVHGERDLNSRPPR